MAAKEVADEMKKPLFVGELGGEPCNDDGPGGGWAKPECRPYPTAALKFAAEAGVQLSNLWTWCTTDEGWCLDPKVNPPAEWAVELMRETTRKLNPDR